MFVSLFYILFLLKFYTFSFFLCVCVLVVVVWFLGGGVFLVVWCGVFLVWVGLIGVWGVDFVSVGEITHSARAVDLSLEVSLERGGGQRDLQGQKT